MRLRFLIAMTVTALALPHVGRSDGMVPPGEEPAVPKTTEPSAAPKKQPPVKETRTPEGKFVIGVPTSTNDSSQRVTAENSVVVKLGDQRVTISIDKERESGHAATDLPLVLATVFLALATILLWLATRVLARDTRVTALRMAHTELTKLALEENGGRQVWANEAKGDYDQYLFVNLHLSLLETLFTLRAMGEQQLRIIVGHHFKNAAYRTFWSKAREYRHTLTESKFQLFKSRERTFQEICEAAYATHGGEPVTKPPAAEPQPEVKPAAKPAADAVSAAGVREPPKDEAEKKKA